MRSLPRQSFARCAVTTCRAYNSLYGFSLTNSRRALVVDVCSSRSIGHGGLSCLDGQHWQASIIANAARRKAFVADIDVSSYIKVLRRQLPYFPALPNRQIRARHRKGETGGIMRLVRNLRRTHTQEIFMEASNRLMDNR